MDHSRKRPTRWPGLRAAVQVIVLAGFLPLSASASRGWDWPVPGDLFLRLSPLTWLVGTAAAWSLAPHIGFVLALLAITAVVGRLFCGWVCPLGTVIDAAGAGNRRRRVRPWPGLKLLVLAALLAAAAAGANFAGWFDPLVMTSRAVHLSHGTQAGWSPVIPVWGVLLVAVTLAFLAPRFWCRAVCPLGAILALAARWAPYRRQIADSCVPCDRCEAACPMGQTRGGYSSAECLGCRRCVAACPRQSVAFGFFGRPSAVMEEGTRKHANASRRRWLLGISSLAFGGLAGGGVQFGRRPGVLRPPGAPSERHLLARCTGCGACLAACPTGGLLPELSFARLDAAFAPRFVPRQGPCLPDCTTCGDVCSTGAIARLSVEKKAAARIGLARIDRSRCLPWARGERCTVCLDACPEEYRAIELRQTDPGEFRPFVDESQCTGCGVCEHRCPLDRAAIRVASEEEMGRRG